MKTSLLPISAPILSPNIKLTLKNKCNVSEYLEKDYGMKKKRQGRQSGVPTGSWAEQDEI